jgi:uncharacterized protein YqhQ
MSESTPTGEPGSGGADVLDELAAAVNGASANGTAPTGKAPKLRLGGMALRNGLLIHGPTSWGAAARAKDGSIDVASGTKPNFGGNKVAKVPALRGPIRLAEAFAVIPIARIALPSARLPFEDPKAIGAGIAATMIGNVIRGKEKRPGVVREGLASAVGLVPSLVSLRGSELAAYHAAEHKAIGGYEEDVDPAQMPKEHQRCGSNLIAPMLVTSLAGQIVVDRLIENPGRIARGVSGLLSISLAVELFVLADRHPDSPLGRAIHASGDAIQRLVATREPTPEQLEVGVAALEAVLAAEAAQAGED